MIFSHTRRLQIFIIIIVLLTIICMLALNSYENWRTLVHTEFSKTESIAKLLDAHLKGTYEDILINNNAQTLSKAEQIALFNEQLQPFVDDVLDSFANYGAGYYVKELDSIVAFGPDFQPDGLKDISPTSKARTVYETLEPLQFQDYSQTRDGYVVAIIYPLIRNGEIIGHVWGNIRIENVYSEFIALLKNRIIFIIVILVAALLGSRILAKQHNANIKKLEEKVRQLEHSDDDPAFFDELTKIYEAVLFSRKKISENQNKFQKIVTEKIMAAQEEERKKVSRELHDGIGQAVYSIFIGLQTLKTDHLDEKSKANIIELENITKATMKEIKEVALNLRPSTLDDLGFIPAIRSYIEQFEKSYHIAVNLTTDGIKKRYDTSIETALYRIVQEALSNAAKYADTKTIDIHISESLSKITMKIIDYGKGFDINKQMELSNGIGLYSINERAQQVGGMSMFHSEVDKGTIVTVSIPIYT